MQGTQVHSKEQQTPEKHVAPTELLCGTILEDRSERVEPLRCSCDCAVAGSADAGVICRSWRWQLARHLRRLDDNCRAANALLLHAPRLSRARFLVDGAVAAPDVGTPVGEAARVNGTNLHLNLTAEVAADTNREHHVQAAPPAATAKSERLGIFTDATRRAPAITTPATTEAEIHERSVHYRLRGVRRRDLNGNRLRLGDGLCHHRPGRRLSVLR